jgi:hypothetical protein
MKESTSRGWKLQDNKIKVASLSILLLILLPNLILFSTSTKLWAGTPGCCEGSVTCIDFQDSAQCIRGTFFPGEICECDNPQESPPCDGECVAPPPPGTRDINVRVIAICASPLAGEPHEGDPFKCLCFGGPLNGYNATMSPDGINCPRRTIGPFCFVTEDFMPLYWKETVRNQSGPTTVEPGGVVEARVHCPEGKMVLSCQGGVTVGDTNEPAANVVGYRFPTADGLSCRYVARTDTVDPCKALAAIAECPCDYNQVPMTTACWGGGQPTFTPCPSDMCTTSPSVCETNFGKTSFDRFMAAGTDDDSQYYCSIVAADLGPQCPDITEGIPGITLDQLRTCLCRLEQYTTELHQSGIEVEPGPPFMCGTATPPP